MCEHCDKIRQTIDMILSLTFMNCPLESVAQEAAYIQDRVRFKAAKHGEKEDILLGLPFMNWSMASIAQVVAYMQARIRLETIKIGEKEEKEYLEWFNKLCDTEFKELNFHNPQEPKVFDESFDFREQMKNGE